MGLDNCDRQLLKGKIRNVISPHGTLLNGGGGHCKSNI